MLVAGFGLVRGGGESVPKPDQKRILWTIVVGVGVVVGGCGQASNLRIDSSPIELGEYKRFLLEWILVALFVDEVYGGPY